MGFDEHLRNAEKTMGAVRSEFALGVQLGVIRPEEVQQFMAKDEELRKKISSMLRGKTVAANGPIFFAKQ